LDAEESRGASAVDFPMQALKCVLSYATNLEAESLAERPAMTEGWVTEMVYKTEFGAELRSLQQELAQQHTLRASFRGAHRREGWGTGHYGHVSTTTKEEAKSWSKKAATECIQRMQGDSFEFHMDEAISRGTRVELHSLQNAPELNGQSGVWPNDGMRSSAGGRCVLMMIRSAADSVLTISRNQMASLNSRMQWGKFDSNSSAHQYSLVCLAMLWL
jgi:hypothetical protein